MLTALKIIYCKMYNIKFFSFGLLLLLVIAGCKKPEKFDRLKWKDGDGIDFPYRDGMLDDLLTNHQLKGLSYRQVRGLLDIPQGKDSLSIYYEIKVNRDTVKPVEFKNLIIYFNKDSV